MICPGLFASFVTNQGEMGDAPSLPQQRPARAGNSTYSSVLAGEEHLLR
jgi:hypothetical protein